MLLWFCEACSCFSRIYHVFRVATYFGLVNHFCIGWSIISHMIYMWEKILRSKYAIDTKKSNQKKKILKHSYSNHHKNPWVPKRSWSVSRFRFHYRYTLLLMQQHLPSMPCSNQLVSLLVRVAWFNHSHLSNGLLNQMHHVHFTCQLYRRHQHEGMPKLAMPTSQMSTILWFFCL